MNLKAELLQSALKRFLQEDVGRGDLGALALPDQVVTGHLLAKQAGVIAGMDLPAAIYTVLDTTVRITPLVHDGEQVNPGTVIAQITGPVATLLAGERVLLNLMQRLSGIATATHLAVHTLADPNIAILDTRKTMPGLREFDKYAVRCGGGVNHRMGLDDAVMLKDNHWAMINDLPTTVARLRRQIGPTKVIEVEVETVAELQAAVASRVDIIMFDNQTPAVVKQWRTLVPPTIKVEVSGGITPATLASYAHTGVDYISLGYLTHSVTALDLAFDLLDK